jgi:hypothetical protein
MVPDLGTFPANPVIFAYLVLVLTIRVPNHHQVSLMNFVIATDRAHF